VNSLTEVAELVKTVPPAERKARARAELAKVRFPATVRLPLNPRLLVSGLLVDEVRQQYLYKSP
jgi:hypothetical protein